MERETVESRQTACAKAEPAAPDSEQPAPHAPSSATSMVLEIPKSIHECVMALAPHIKTMRTLAFQSNHDMTVHYELEARFGRCDDKSRFVPDVGGSMGKQIEQMLLSFEQWDSVSDGWIESHDYFYTHQGQRIRTSVTFNGGKMSQHHVLKSTIAKLTMGFDTVLENSQPVHIRAIVAQEQHIQPKMVPDIVQPEYVRIKQRRSFRRGCWSFDLTRTWQGKDRQEAEVHQDNQEPCYEFEVECCNPRVYFQEKFHTDEYIATSLIMKMKDFLPFAYNSIHMHVVSDTRNY